MLRLIFHIPFRLPCAGCVRNRRKGYNRRREMKIEEENEMFLIKLFIKALIRCERNAREKAINEIWCQRQRIFHFYYAPRFCLRKALMRRKSLEHFPAEEKKLQPPKNEQLLNNLKPICWTLIQQWLAKVFTVRNDSFADLLATIRVIPMIRQECSHSTQRGKKSD